MEKLSRLVTRFCHSHHNLGIPGLMRYIVMANVVVFLMDMFSKGTLSALLSFNPYYIFNHGQIWRLFTFWAVPTTSSGGSMSILFFAISTMCYYFIGNSLERQWGTTRFTIFYGLGVILSALGGLILFAFYPYGSAITASMYYVNLSLFFSIATLYPNLQFYLYFIIPVKAKWMGWFSGGLFAFDVCNYLLDGLFAMALVPILALFNYFIFFWDDISRFLSRISGGSGKSRPQSNQTNRNNTINFNKAAKEVQQRKGYLNKCEICGKTDTSHPEMDFRYCSKCEGTHCYCMDHINNHEHIH